MVVVGFGQEFYRFKQVIYNVFALEPAAFYAHDEGHETHAGAASGDHFAAIIVGEVAAFAGQARGGVCEIPEVFDGLFLNGIHPDTVLHGVVGIVRCTTQSADFRGEIWCSGRRWLSHCRE